MIQNKAMKSLRDYFDNVYGCPLVMASAWAELPDNHQEKFYEMCEAYILEFAQRDRVYTHNMVYYHERAVKMAKSVM